MMEDQSTCAVFSINTKILTCFSSVDRGTAAQAAVRDLTGLWKEGMRESGGWMTLGLGWRMVRFSRFLC